MPIQIGDLVEITVPETTAGGYMKGLRGVVVSKEMQNRPYYPYRYSIMMKDKSTLPNMYEEQDIELVSKDGYFSVDDIHDNPYYQNVADAMEPYIREELETVSKPRIVCAANRLEDGTIIIGVRHFDPFMYKQLHTLGYVRAPKHEQGFVDQFGEFYDRQQAWKVAASNGQIIRRCGGDDGILFSENLY